MTESPLYEKDKVVAVLESLLKSVKESQHAKITQFNASRGVIEGEPDNGFKTFKPDPQTFVKMELDYYQQWEATNAKRMA